ncbi:MAG TPA: MarR family transcriptional regulator [Cytophagales bacterium]|nr:MarR family transcriptional regulator [Cytophagales bacterium]HAP63608.1 MarR family transcriptional regulator [Cytophagales bacterium]
MDYIKDLGYRALDSRFKRISDRMAHDIRKVYREQGLEIEPNWYLILLLLKENGQLSIAQIAERLGYAHPTMAILVKKMVAKGFLATQADAQDKRKQQISLSSKAKNMLPQLEEIWARCDEAILQILGNDLQILPLLDAMEARLGSQSFYQRFQDELSKNSRNNS